MGKWVKALEISFKIFKGSLVHRGLRINALHNNVNFDVVYMCSMLRFPGFKSWLKYGT